MAEPLIRACEMTPTERRRRRDSAEQGWAPFNLDPAHVLWLLDAADDRVALAERVRRLEAELDAAARVRRLYADALSVIANHPGGDSRIAWVKGKAAEALAKSGAAARGDIYAQIDRAALAERVEVLEAAATELLATLPQCQACERPGTREDCNCLVACDDDSHACPEDGGPEDLPWANALRKLSVALAPPEPPDGKGGG